MGPSDHTRPPSSSKDISTSVVTATGGLGRGHHPKTALIPTELRHLMEVIKAHTRCRFLCMLFQKSLCRENEVLGGAA